MSSDSGTCFPAHEDRMVDHAVTTRWKARVTRLRVPADDCTGDDALHQVVCRYLQRGGRREEVYPRLRNLLKELAPAVPEPLR